MDAEDGDDSWGGTGKDGVGIFTAAGADARMDVNGCGGGEGVTALLVFLVLVVVVVQLGPTVVLVVVVSMVVTNPGA